MTGGGVVTKRPGRQREMQPITDVHQLTRKRRDPRRSSTNTFGILYEKPEQAPHYETPQRAIVKDDYVIPVCGTTGMRHKTVPLDSQALQAQKQKYFNILFGNPAAGDKPLFEVNEAVSLRDWSKQFQEKSAAPWASETSLQRDSFTEKKIDRINTRHGFNPFSTQTGIVPVSKGHPERPNVWRESISFENMYDSRNSAANYPIRGKRHGSFVWRPTSEEERSRVLDSTKRLSRSPSAREAVAVSPPSSHRAARMLQWAGLERAPGKFSYHRRYTERNDSVRDCLIHA